MEQTIKAVSVEQKEAVAISVMRCMLLQLSEETNRSFEQTMLDFSESETYNDLFDFDTEIWKEGPDYLRDLYEEELRGKRNNSTDTASLV